jgi:hypothetical protein
MYARTSECIFCVEYRVNCLYIFDNGVIFRKEHSESALGQLRCRFCVTRVIQGSKANCHWSIFQHRVLNIYHLKINIKNI